MHFERSAIFFQSATWNKPRHIPELGNVMESTNNSAAWRNVQRERFGYSDQMFSALIVNLTKFKQFFY